MALNYGVRVDSYNTSKAQIKFAREPTVSEGYADRENDILNNYRYIQGEFDVFVSVGMLEHVGRGLIHSIGQNDPASLNVWLRKRIVPGAYAPSIGEIMDVFEPYDFGVLDVKHIRLHYAKTLLHRLQRYRVDA